MTLTLTFDRVIRHTVVYHSSTSVYIPNFVQIGKKLLWTELTDIETGIIRSTRGVDLKIKNKKLQKKFNAILTGDEVYTTRNGTASFCLASPIKIGLE